MFSLRIDGQRRDGDLGFSPDELSDHPVPAAGGLQVRTSVFSILNRPDLEADAGLLRDQGCQVLAVALVAVVALVFKRIINIS